MKTQGVYCAVPRKADSLREVRAIADTPELIVEAWTREIQTRPEFRPQQETLWVISLNTRMRITGISLISIGAENETIAQPKDVFLAVIASGNSNFVIMHNHPSGDPSPSEADRRLTTRLQQGADLLNLRLVDHVIVGSAPEPITVEEPYFSFREAGSL